MAERCGRDLFLKSPALCLSMEKAGLIVGMATERPALSMEEAADHRFALSESFSLEQVCNLLQQIWNLKALRAFLKAILAMRA